MTDFSARPTEGAPTDVVDCPLIGEDGNGFFIVGRLRQALRKAGASKEYVEAVSADMMSGDYDHLLQVALREINGNIGTEEDGAVDIVSPGVDKDDEEADFDFIMGLRR